MINSATIDGFTSSVLAWRYDDPKIIPDHHREMWELCTSDYRQVAIAAPRGSAKSTAVTFAYVLASVLFQEHQHVLIISANEEIASLFLNDIKIELAENDVLREAFGFKKFIKERETEIICEMKDGFRFRIIVKGAEQKMRGLKWERKRPSLIVADDLEEEDLVASQTRREKFKRWWLGAVQPLVKYGGKIRIVGTIMHMDSLLMGFMPPRKSAFTVDTPLRMYTESDPEKIKNIEPAYHNDRANRSWKAVLFRAHSIDFKELLWKEMYPEARLREIRQEYAETGMLDVYGQEYLNDPIDMTTAYFRKSDFLPMKEDDFETHKTYYASGDLAITQNKRSAYTALIVGGMDSQRTLFITDVRRDRIDSLEIANEMFSIQKRWNIDTFRLESENIEKSIGPFIYERMGSVRDGEYQEFINIDAKNPTKDKEARAQTLKAMMRAGRIKFDKEADWYADLEEEMLHFPKWPTVDQVDAFAWLCLLVANMAEGLTQEEEYEEEWEDSHDLQDLELGASVVTGY